MKNLSVFSVLYIAILIAPSFVHAMEEPSTKRVKTLEYEDAQYRELVKLRSQLVHMLYSDEYDDKAIEDRQFVAKQLNALSDSPLLYYEVPGENVSFLPVIAEVANRFSLRKIKNRYVAYPLSQSVPRRK